MGLTGTPSLSGWPDRPLSFGMAYTDIIGPRFATAALIAALVHRQKTGKGQLIDVAQLEAGLQFMVPALLDYFTNGRDFTRRGNSCPYAAPHGVYRCRGDDRWCAISVFTDEEWESFCTVIGNLAWTEDPRFNTLLGRKQNEEVLNKLIEEWTIKYTAEEVMHLMQAAGVPAGVVKSPKDVSEDSQLWYRQYWATLDHPQIGPFAHLSRPFVLSETPGNVHMPAPCLGEHTELVCREFLGMSDGEFLELLQMGVFE